MSNKITCLTTAYINKEKEKCPDVPCISGSLYVSQKGLDVILGVATEMSMTIHVTVRRVSYHRFREVR